jgi:natural product precursor
MSIKLNRLNENELSTKMMKEVKAGKKEAGTPVSCGCGCHYEGNNGSSVDDNCKANYSGGEAGGLTSPGGTVAHCNGSIA